MVNAIFLLRIFAILLIMNQHMFKVYPSAGLAVGGHLGNSLFFFISGWGLMHSYNRNPMALYPWYRKRFLKLVAMVVVVCVMLYFPNPARLWDSLVFHLKPFPFGSSENFLNVLVFLYALSFPIFRLSDLYKKIVVLICLILPVALYLGIGEGERLIAYTYPVSALCCFVLGMLAENKDRIFVNPALRSMLFCIGALPVVALLHGKARGFADAELYSYYVALLEVVALYSFFTNLEQKISFENWWKPLSMLASCSLAVYLVHFHVIQYFVLKQLTGVGYVLQIMLGSFSLALAMDAVSKKTLRLLHL